VGDTLNKLEEKRPEYKRESCWHKLLLDAYRGSGGFQGSTKQPEAGFWGAAAESYTQFSTFVREDKYSAETYLDRYPREDIDKFQRRVQVAHYPNYVKPTTNLKISHIVRKPHKRNNVPDAVAEWIERTGWDKGFRSRALLSAVLGYWPAFVDKPAAGSKDMDPYVVMFMPSQLFQYSIDDRGVPLWVKFGTSYCERKAWDTEEITVKRFTILDRESFYVYEARGDGEPQLNTGKHGMLGVPVVFWRSEASMEDSVKADSINSEIVPEVRRLFNLCSELDENLRSNVFALLLVPGASGDSSDGGGNPKEVGTENGLTVTPDQKNLPQFIAPPASVAETYETRIEKTIIEIYRMARVEYAKAEGTQTSAQSKDANFKQTNLSIVDLATSLAIADRETLILVGRALGVNEEKLQAIECVAHETYDEGELNDEIQQVIDTLTLQIGNTAKGELTKRLVFKQLPGIGAEQRKAIESEIDEAIVEAEQESELLKEAAAEAAANPDQNADPNADPNANQDDQIAAEE
jgi:hypothetical protein